MAYVEPYKVDRIRRVRNMSYTANVSLLSDSVFMLNIFTRYLNLILIY